MRTLRIALLGLCWLIGATQASAQEDVPTVAVFDLRATAIGRPDIKELATTFTDMLTTELAKSSAIRIITREELEAALTKNQFLLSGRVSDEEALRAGRIIGANYFVLGGVFFERGMARMDIRLVETETTRTHAAVKKTYKESELLTLVEEIASALTKDVKIPVIARGKAAEAPVSAVLAYSRGLDFEKRGKKDQAVAMYEKTLQLSPGYDDAQKALARVK